MKTGKDISTLFRDGSRELRVEPGSRAWDRLEGRLDRQGKHARVVALRWAMAAAASVLLVAGIFFWNNAMKQATFAILDPAPPLHIEDLENKDGCEPFCLVLRARAELPEYYAFPVSKSH